MTNNFYTPEQIKLLKYTSYSYNETLYTCPRRFELDKLLGRSEKDSATFAFGKAVGAGAQKYMESGDLQAAIWDCFCFWSIDLDDESEISSKKTFWYAVAAVDSFKLVMDNALKNWRVLEFKGKPATELSFHLDLGDDFGYFGHVDAALQNTKDGSLGVFEGKTTKFREVDEASYKNSNQGVGYSLLLDTISELAGIPEGNKYSVFYPVYKTSVMAWDFLPFAKTYTMRADFIQSLLFDKQTIQMYIDAGKFPKRGSGCYNFFRRCPHFDICDMSNKYLLSGVKDDKAVANLYGSIDEKHDIYLTLEQVIDAQIRRATASSSTVTTQGDENEEV